MYNEHDDHLSAPFRNCKEQQQKRNCKEQHAKKFLTTTMWYLFLECNVGLVLKQFTQLVTIGQQRIACHDVLSEEKKNFDEI